MRTTETSLRKGRVHHFHHFEAVLWHWNEIVRAGNYCRRIFSGTHATAMNSILAPQHSSASRLADANFIGGALVMRSRPCRKFQSAKKVIVEATNWISKRSGPDVAGGIS